MLYRFGSIFSSILLMSAVSVQLSVFAQSTSTTQFRDIAGDIYANEIEQAVTLGIVAGFEDQTFRPQTPVTREQLVSTVVRAMGKVPLANQSQTTNSTLPTVPTQITTNPFSDVDKTRWSAPQIQYLKDLGIVRGYPDGTFHPTQTVTRAELIVMLQAVDRYLVEFRGNWDGRRPYTQPVPLNFSDIQNHWARATITEMSGNCHTGQVATPLNETGTQFAPNTAAQRNYAAAAIVREVRCLSVPAISP
ncbi:S-layer homology domain-containing protein [Pantanalinema sp. GBBB05]|uniref:S-layer homology domain-containing protein n=1 Tax=Pantanalinema sp. GBBB05 TaxID=2604139 RepID=UPI001E0CE04D|nr:S-layer homology domain-containing protein [Pantanalinema sp. GBBB05]